MHLTMQATFSQQLILFLSAITEMTVGVEKLYHFDLPPLIVPLSKLDSQG